MSINNEKEYLGIKKVSELVALTLREMRAFAKVGMTKKELDDFGGEILRKYGANSAPRLTYNFPGNTCISVNREIAHGLPNSNKKFIEGDLINVDVSAELNGFWADNGCSFILGKDLNCHQKLVNASKTILNKAIDQISDGVKISDIGYLIEREAHKMGYKVIKNLAGHGVGRSLHESPKEIPNFRDLSNFGRFKKNSVVAIETFISTKSTLAAVEKDGWTLVGNKGGFVAQHEHTIMVTSDRPFVFTSMNGIN